ncbi:cytochrome P450, partial [Hypoxylon fragiforme]|uniref:cytochrome P450 n=1 Tax=Hypoxylon fragiforme TaxID=63214 RepID=UPI0020C6A0D1
MGTSFSIIVVVIISLVFSSRFNTFTQWVFHRLGRKTLQQHPHLLSVEDHRDIADFSILGKDVGLVDKLTARAVPNHRLVKAFAIANSFTTTDTTIHNEFVTSVDRALDHLETAQHSVNLACLARVYCLGVILNVLFGKDPQTFDIDDAVVASDAINRLWVDSKDVSRPVSPKDQAQLQDSLRRLLPDSYSDVPEKQPLNLIMPAYETMWRIVLQTYISAGFRAPDQTTAQHFQEVVQSVPQCFGNQSMKYQEDKALAFSKEALRLYPPTKRIHRAVPQDRDSNPDSPQPCNRGSTYATVSADVEACHRDPSQWGRDALAFCPSRFSTRRWPDDPSHTPARPPREAYMPFGVGKHMCPAGPGTGFANRVVVILAVTLAKRLGTGGSGAAVVGLDGDVGRLLPSGREDMEGWVLEMNVDVEGDDGDGKRGRGSGEERGGQL